jgi:hypothetical protein
MKVITRGKKSTDNSPKLKLGLLLDSFIIPAWEFNSLERVINLDCVEICIIILRGHEDSPQIDTDLFFSEKHNYIYRLFNFIDKKFFLRGADALAVKNVQKLFVNTPTIRVEPISNDKFGCIPPSVIAELINYDLDILIRMGFEILTGDILTVARYGVWSYSFIDTHSSSSNPIGFWEVINRIPETGSILYILNEGSSIGKILYKSWVQTFQFSPARNRNRCLWQSSSFLSRQIQLLHRLGEKDFFIDVGRYNKIIEQYAIGQIKQPSIIRLIWLYIGLLIRNIREIFFRTFNFHHWFLLFSPDDNLALTVANFKEINPPKDRFWADPHIIHFDNKEFIFIEEYIYKDRKAHISVFELMQDDVHPVPIQVLSTDYHLSYPSVFMVNDKFYMIPETSAHRTIELYECENFPYDWKFKMNLMEDIIAVDTTVLYLNNNWWLFTGITENEGAFPECELFLFYSDELFTKDWKPHPLNPIISDVKNARPAGDIFIKHEKMYRPSQDCSKNYGWGVNLNEILLLSETEYLEKKVVELRPGWEKCVIGVHTYASVESLTVVDAVRKRQKLF